MVHSLSRWDRARARTWFPIWLLLLALGGIHPASRGVGPPLDLSGDWEAIPGVFQPHGGPYHRLHFELQALEALPVLPDGLRRYEARYTGQLTYFETRHFYTAPAGCDAGANVGPGAYDPFPYTYSLGYGLNVTSYWTIRPDSGVIRVGSIEGLGRFNLPTIPRPHGDFNTQLLFGFNPGTGQEPVADSHARLRLVGVPQPGGEHVASDRCFNSPFGTGSDHGQMSFWRVSSGPAELAAKGTLRGRLTSAVTVLTSGTGDEIHRATVQVFRQDDHLRDQRPGESDRAYRDYLESQSILAAPAATLTPDDEGRFRFDNLPLFARATSSGPAPAWRPQRYWLRVVSAETDEMALDSEANPIPGRTNTLQFLGQERLNLLADTELEIALRPHTSLAAKRDLIAEISRLGPTRYAPIEARASAHLDTLASQEVLTDAQDEGLRRALWAERVVRDGARYANTALDLGLTGLGTVLADALGDLKRWEGAGVADARKQFQKVRDTPRPGATSGFDLDSVGDLTPAMRQLLERGRTVELADEMIKMVKALRPVLQEALLSRGVAPENAKRIAVGIEQAMLGLLNVVRNQTARGATKDVLKALIKEYLDDALKPVLYDGVVPYSFTALTAPSLEDSVDQMIRWNRSDQTAYLRDRDRTVVVLNQLGQAASDVLSRAILFQAGGEAADLTQKYAGLAGLVPPARAYAMAVENFAKAAKYVANGAGILGPVVYTFAGGPHLVAEGVHAAYGGSASSGSTPGPATDAESLASPRALATHTTTVFPPLTMPSVQPMLADLLTLDGLLRSNRVGAAIQFAAGREDTGTGTGTGYARSWENWLRKVAQVEVALQAYAVPENRDTFSLVVPHAVFYRLKSEILSAKVAHDEALLDWFLGVLGGAYTDATDPRSLAAAARASAAGRVLALLLESSPTEFRPILDQVGVFRTRLPAVYLEWQREGTETGMPTELVQSPQRFQVRAQVESLGATNLNGIQVALRLPPNQTVLRVLGETIHAVRFPLADDGKPGPVSLAWELEYVGSFLESSVEFDLEVLERGSVPAGFVANSVSGRILVAPEVRDRDLDGLPDTFEARYGLNPTEDDRTGDRDGDRLTNGEEFLWGTRPDLADSDGDGLSDREELVPGADGVRSSPTLADSDADGVADAGDGAPFDAGSTQVSGEPGRIDWSLDRARVTLTRAEPAALVAIRSTPPGALRWRAEVEDPTLVEASPTYGSSAATSSSFLVGLPAGFRWPTSGTYSTRVRVRNEADPLAGSTDLEVWVQADFASAVAAHLSENRESLVLEWEAVAGMRYTVEGSDDLQTWTKSTTAPVAVGTRSLRWSETRAVIEGAGRGRFYRVLAQPR